MVKQAKIDDATLVKYFQKIAEAKTLDELKTLGRELTKINGKRKSWLVKFYLGRKAEITKKIVARSKNKTFVAAYELIRQVNDLKILRSVGLLIYSLRDYLNDEECNIIFDYYFRKKKKLTEKVFGTPESIENMEDEEDMEEDVEEMEEMGKMEKVEKEKIEEEEEEVDIDEIDDII